MWIPIREKLLRDARRVSVHCRGEHGLRSAVSGALSREHEQSSPAKYERDRGPLSTAQTGVSRIHTEEFDAETKCPVQDQIETENGPWTPLRESVGTHEDDGQEKQSERGFIQGRRVNPLRWLRSRARNVHGPREARLNTVTAVRCHVACEPTDRVRDQEAGSRGVAELENRKPPLAKDPEHDQAARDDAAPGCTIPGTGEEFPRSFAEHPLRVE